MSKKWYIRVNEDSFVGPYSSAREAELDIDGALEESRGYLWHWAPIKGAIKIHGYLGEETAVFNGMNKTNLIAWRLTEL